MHALQNGFRFNLIAVYFDKKIGSVLYAMNQK